MSMLFCGACGASEARERRQDKTGWIVLDQIRTVDKRRLVKRLGRITKSEAERAKGVIKEMLVD